jgi:orotidine-5'-phosphate decarboxylase
VPEASSAASPIDVLAAAVDRLGTPACVGLDPDPARFPGEIRVSPGANPAGAIETFCLGVIDAVCEIVPAVKPQSAHFERWGPGGYAALWRVIAHARERGLFVVLDAKRGDIGSTADHYAAGAKASGANSITANPYLGPSGLEPFLNAPLLTYALVRTSNPDSDVVQSIVAADGRTVAEHVAEMVDGVGRGHVGSRGLSSLGAVVGATKSEADGERLRELMPNTPFLVPGVGAQGGTAADVRPLVRAGAKTPGECGVLVNASRSVLYPEKTRGPWTDSVAEAAKRFADSLRAIVQ